MRTKLALVIGQVSAPASLVDDTGARRCLPVRIAGSGGERLHRGHDGLAALVDQFAGAELGLPGIGIFDVADRALGPGHGVGHALVAAGADAGRPFDRRHRADLRPPVRAHLGKVIGEGERGAGAVGAMHHGDGLRGQLQVLIELADRSIVPRPDLAEKDPGNGRPVEDELGGLDALDVDHHGDAAHDRRELHESIRVQVGGAQRHVGGPEGHLLALDLPDALTRADRLVIDGDAGLFPVGLGPFRVDRIRKVAPAPETSAAAAGAIAAAATMPAAATTQHIFTFGSLCQGGRPPPPPRVAWLYDGCVTV